MNCCEPFFITITTIIIIIIITIIIIIIIIDCSVIKMRGKLISFENNNVGCSLY